jgi:hypothetical protein
MKAYFPLILTSLVACGGPDYEKMLNNPMMLPENNSPGEVYERTIEKSSVEGLFAREAHKRGNHGYEIWALFPEILIFTVGLTETSSISRKKHGLVDYVYTTSELDIPSNDSTRDTLYRVLLWEQKESLDENIIKAKEVAKLTDFVLKGLEE